MSGVCGVATLGNGTTIARAPRLASVRSCAQRDSRGKFNRLLAAQIFQVVVIARPIKQAAMFRTVAEA